ncbi:cytochrome B [uncultured archaeon]|nr:cytochrome B [uncultured archaeon]HKJ96512.1 cytochrome bc complex cytochrome b subunit [Thermoplasmataceae archaeon]
MTEKNDPVFVKMMNDPQPIPRRVPDYMRKKGGIWYWTGALVTIAFLYEALTGLVILFYYQPANAYGSTTNFLNSTPFGSVILTTHLYGAYAMIVLLYAHLLRNLFVGAFKKPRMTQWFTGILLLLLTIGVGFFGYSMSGDVLSADATDVGRGIAQGAPLIGGYIERIFFGDGTALSLFQRMLGWHIVLTALIGVLFMVHFIIAEFNTIMPKITKKEFKAPLIDHEKPDYKPWYPYNILYMVELTFFMFFMILLIPSVLTLISNVPALFSPLPQVSPSSPLASIVPPYPPWFLLFVYKAMDFNMVSVIGTFWGTVLFGGAPLIYLLLLPILDRGSSLKLVERPLTVSLGIVGLIYMMGLSIWGALTPGVIIPDWEVLLFFLIPAVVVFLLVYSVTGWIKRGRLKHPHPERIFINFTFLGLSSFGLGMLLSAFLTSRAMMYEIPLVLLAMAASISFISLFIILNEKPEIVEEESPRMMRSRYYVAYSGGFAMSSVAIIYVISGIPDNSLTNGALYGIGLAILFLIAGAIVKIYRRTQFGE